MQQNDQMLGMWRAAAKAANATANSLISGTARMLERQAEISRQLLAEYANAAKQIESASGVPSLVSIQGRLARVQAERATHWCAECYAEAGMAQKELLRTTQAFVLDVAETMSRALDGMAPAPGTEPVVKAMKLVVDATRSSYAATSEAATARTAIVEAEPAKGSNRQAAG